MICQLCGEYIPAIHKKSLYIQGNKVVLHKKCLRKATKKDLIEKGLIKPDSCSWWTIYGEGE